jgi:glutathione S-transferase
VERIWERREEFLEVNPAGTVPVLQEANGLTITDSYAICEYLDEAYPDFPLLGRTLAERVEVRRLVAWFDGKFYAEVTRNLYYEKQQKRLLGRGNPDAAAIRAGYANLKPHMEYIGWLAETRAWLAGPFAEPRGPGRGGAAFGAGLSRRRGLGLNDAAKDWYARIKSRPSFRGLLSDRVSGLEPPAHYADLDF